MEEEDAARRKEEWQLRDAALHSKFLREKRKRLLQKEQQEKQEALIKKEWEEKQKKEREEEEKKKEEQVWLKEISYSLVTNCLAISIQTDCLTTSRYRKSRREGG
ncbi:hypothetical protein OTU49_004967 [Cherax quadricarinatus]